MLKIQEIREIIRLIDQSSINEFTYEQDGATISIKKPEVRQLAPEQTQVIQEQAEKQVIKEEQVQVEQPVPDATIPAVEAETSDDEDFVEIVSPMVGTFYRKPAPESDTYVEIGDNVSEDSIVCIVEAMKLFNEIEAETTGEIVEILVNDGELVEYGQALFKVKAK